jgi:hypothetical protein
MVATGFGTGQVFWSMLYFFLFFLWIWLAFAVVFDIFRSHDLSGWGKALWVLFVIFMPFLGIFVYLIARGSKMGQHAADDAQAQDAMFREYVKEVAQPSDVDQLTQLVSLHDKGVIDDEEFERMKARVIQPASSS